MKIKSSVFYVYFLFIDLTQNLCLFSFTLHYLMYSSLTTLGVAQFSKEHRQEIRNFAQITITSLLVARKSSNKDEPVF